MSESGRKLFPRLLSDEDLENDIRTKWFREHGSDHAVYALQGKDFTDAIEQWIVKTFPQHKDNVSHLSGAIWFNRGVINLNREKSSGLGGFLKRLAMPRGDMKDRWNTD